MSSTATTKRIENQADQKQTVRSKQWVSRAGLFILFLACSLAVFLLGCNYYPLFATNGSKVYNGSIAILFLAAALLFRRTPRFHQYWPVTYAFFVAATVNFVSAALAGYNTLVLQTLGVLGDANQTQALAKLYDTALVVIPILVLIRLSGADLGSLYLKKGNLHFRWGWGIGALVLVDFFSSALIFFGTNYQIAQLGPVILWGMVFSFSNSLLEELWVRGLFLKKLVPLIGGAGAVLLTSTWFGALHLISVAYLPAVVIPVFVVNTFTMGLACSILMLKTDSIWGAYMIHAAADLFLFIALLAVH